MVESARASRARNPERARETDARVYQRKRTQRQWDTLGERARREGAEPRLTREEWDAVLSHFGQACAYCGAGGRLTLDHMVPLRRGGTHDVENVVPACLSCNSRKHTKTPLEWFLECAAPTTPGERARRRLREYMRQRRAEARHQAARSAALADAG